MQTGRACVIVALALLAGACASIQPPQPWEKGDLAKPQMQLDPEPLTAKGTQHIYQSKEGAAGGYGVGGGGCGCN
ncbi:MAG TPA: DUF4266 domain-containing protein [Casimicrobiaceae bacterium]|nr:DUF4266 domain-containing protein [Casimicrobiaceae bacterium]